MRRAARELTAARAVLLAMCAWDVASAQDPDPSHPESIPKYQQRLVVPPAMPVTSRRAGVDYYEIAVQQLTQQILPPPLPATTVWSYGSVNHPGTLNYPAFTIEAKFRRPVRVKWINGLVDERGDYLPHLLAVDQTLHWANPPGGVMGRDMHSVDPEPYRGPVPMVPHLHGGHNAQESDGYPEAWFLPAAENLPAGYATEGTWYGFFGAEFERKFGVAWEPGTATFQYENHQRPSTLWYHDHTLGMTRVNVYAGPAGFYLIRRGPGDLPDAVLPGPAPSVGSDPFGRFYEIPIVIQDRSFNGDGSLFYPDTRASFDEFAGPYVPESDISPIWNPEFFGNTIVVNGRTWPKLEVEPRRYRFRLLNGCNSRFLLLRLAVDDTPADGSIDDGDYTALSLPFWQIGTEGGFLPAPVNLDELLMGLAERADVIIDFGAIARSRELGSGDAIYLVNEGPDEPFGGGVPGVDFDAADAGTTRQVMKLELVELASKDKSEDPARLTLPAFEPLGPASHTRQVSLNEADSAILEDVGPREAQLGTMDGATPRPLDWDNEITELPTLGAIEVWEMYNFTADAHPIHIHEVQFQVVDRQPFGGVSRAREAWEAGFKDTVIAYPGEITRVKARFDQPGLYAWHCHIIEHEDNEMMRPYCVGECPTLPSR